MLISSSWPTSSRSPQTATRWLVLHMRASIHDLDLLLMHPLSVVVQLVCAITFESEHDLGLYGGLETVLRAIPCGFCSAEDVVESAGDPRALAIGRARRLSAHMSSHGAPWAQSETPRRWMCFVYVYNSRLGCSVCVRDVIISVCKRKCAICQVCGSW